MYFQIYTKVYGQIIMIIIIFIVLEQSSVETEMKSAKEKGKLWNSAKPLNFKSS